MGRLIFKAKYLHNYKRVIILKLVLGIESSCDETAASVTLSGRKVLSDVIYSQTKLHEEYGGVVPEIASRKHIEVITFVIEKALRKANVSKNDLDAVAVTNGPGLIGALLAGLSVAKGLSYSIKKPLVPVNHIHGHICANYIASPELEPPFVCLVASGGHSHVLSVSDYNKYEVLGATLDDAAGEAFDKVARVLGLSYPGGPAVSALAERGNPKAVSFPRPIQGYNFSFSGVKTAVINYIHNMEQKGGHVCREDVAASFQAAVCDVLTEVTINAAKNHGAKKIALAGGVASNKALRASLSDAAKGEDMNIFIPTPSLCTDNGAMISCAGYFGFLAGNRAGLDTNAVATLPL